MPDQNPPVELSVALETLREELEEAWIKGQGHRIRFQVPHVTLTVQATARRDTTAGGKLRWWLIEGGAEHGSAHENLQTLVLNLSPQLYDEAGHAGPLEVAGDQAAPGQ